MNLSCPSPVPVTVNYQTSDNTATTANNDYQPATSSIIIPALTLSGIITVNGVGDLAVEANETFTVTITSVTGGAVLGSSVTATGTILNDDVACGVAFTDGVFNDSDWTLTMETVGFTFGATVGGSQVASGGNPGQYRSALSQPGCCMGHTEAWGFNLRSGAVYNPAVQGPITSISYSEDFTSIVMSSTCQPQETGPALSQGGQLYYYAPFGWSPSRCSVWTHLSRESITALDFRTVASASAHPDFSAAGGPIQFGYVRGSLADNGSYTANGGIDNWTLIVNPPQATLAAGPSVNEGNSGLTPFNFTVNLSCPSPVPVTVNYQTSDNTATTANNDYQPATSSIIIPALTLSGIITVNGVGDLAVEANETFTVTITSVTGGAVLGSSVTATGTILNDDTVSGVDGGTTPGEFSLKFNEPNPFRSSTTIGYTLPVKEHVLLRVFDLSGHLVKTLVDRDMSPGNEVVHWDGRNESGEAMSAGIYFYRLEAGAFQKTRRMILLK